MKTLKSVGDFLVEAGFFLLGIIPAIFIFVCGLAIFRSQFVSGFWDDIQKQGFFYFVFAVCYQAGLIAFLFLYFAFGLVIPKKKEDRRCCYV